MTKKIDPFQRMLLIIIVVYSVFVTIKNPGFFQIQTVFDIIKTSSTTMIVAMGLLVVMISGGIDVSFMAIALFGSYTSLYIMIQTGINNLAFAFAVSMAIGVVLGSGECGTDQLAEASAFYHHTRYAEPVSWYHDNLYQ